MALKRKKAPHYNSHPSGFEILKIVKHETFTRGNILKYVFRAPYKGAEVADLRKALDYLLIEIKLAEKRERLAARKPPVPTVVKLRG